MEHRDELQELLLNGLPEQERGHVLKVMQEMTVRKLRRKRSEDSADNELIDLTELDLADDY